VNIKPIPTRTRWGAICIALTAVTDALGTALLNLVAALCLAVEWALDEMRQRVEADFDEGRSYVWCVLVAFAVAVGVVTISDTWPVVIAWLGINTTACTPVNPCR
jgi:hypothetical protein